MKNARAAAVATAGGICLIVTVAACATPTVGTPIPVVLPAAQPATTTVVAAPQTVVVQQPAPQTTTYVVPPDTSAGQTVIAYYDAINRGDFLSAWNLGGSRIAGGGGYTTYAHAFATTSWDTLTVTEVDGNVVHVQLAARQTDGSLRTFAGTYTVANGVIVGSHMARTS